jgi:hypothetical protein
LDAALEYYALGWSLMRMRMRTRAKRPAGRWKGLQTCRADQDQLRRWFGKGGDYGIAVIFGEVSGWLASRDFDKLAAYERWAADHSDLAALLPTVETRRGRHVYFLTTPDNVAAVRMRLHKPNGTGAISLGDGELRAGVGCYSVLPPSRHPSGHPYRWSIPLSGRPPVVDLLLSGLALSHTEDTDNPGLLTRAQEMKKVGGCVLEEGIEWAIAATLPTEVHERHKCIFEFARHLKAVSGLADAKATDLEPYVRLWHQAALPIIYTKPWEETWFDFLDAWPRVRYPAGQEPLALAWAAAQAAPVPAVALRYESPRLRLLVALCRELQRTVGDNAFFLSCRKADELIGLGDYSGAAKWLRGLCNAGVLELVKQGDRATGHASSYRYLHPLD